MKKIENWTANQLSAEIQAIKAEREKMANTLKLYEEELERRNQEACLENPPIDIRFLLPWLKKGWVAMDRNGAWYWYKDKPFKGGLLWNLRGSFNPLPSFLNIKSADNWETSLMECGL